MDNTLIIYCDGSCNNAKEGKGAREGGTGVVMRYNGHEKKFSHGCYTNTSSARMEIMAMIHALEAVRIPKGKRNKMHIILHTDNKYCSDTINQEWLTRWKEQCTFVTRKNADLWQRFSDIYETLGGRRMITIKWVRGHAGHELNELADELANKGRLSKNKTEDIEKRII